MPTPDEILKGWVAVGQQLPTEVINPTYIDHTAIEDLAFYHPGFDSSTPHRFRHIAASDNKGAYAHAELASFSPNWHEKMQEVMEKVRLRLADDHGFPCLIDSDIGTVDTRPMHGWRVVHWKTVKARDIKMQQVHQDFITWRQESSGRLVLSMFSWRPYVSLEVRGQGFRDVRLVLGMVD